MSVAVSYPGVYVEEISSGVRTITGVATSITAFIGRAVKGSPDDPVIINSFADFERRFGGLHVDYPMSYAVRDFYLNGGSKAVIVRLYKGAGGSAQLSLAGTDAGKQLDLVATEPGSWADKLRARIDDKVSEEIATRYGLAKTDLFNLTLRMMPNGPQETFGNLTVKESPRRVDRVLLADSTLVRVADPTKLAMPKAHGDPDPGKTIWEDDKASTPVAGADTGKNSADLTSKDDFLGKQDDKTGMYALRKTDLFNILCIPPDKRDADPPTGVYSDAMSYCVKRRAMLIVDAPAGWKDANDITANNNKKITDLGLNGDGARNAALFFPRVIEADSLRESQEDTFVPCGIVAGAMARTDASRGVWKAPAGLDASLNGIVRLAVNMTDDENGMLNPLGVNCLRTFPNIGSVVWGSRTLRGADLLADEYKYIPVRRLALFIEESLFRGTQWVVFEPNDEPLWSQIRLNIGAFMHNLFRQGAFQGKTPNEAYFVKCDKDTTTQNDINLGIVNIVVGFAPLKPAEFVIIKIQQIAGDIAV